MNGTAQIRRQVPTHGDITLLMNRVCELTMKQNADTILYVSGMMNSLERILYAGHEHRFDIGTIQQVHDLHTRFVAGIDTSVNSRDRTSLIVHPTTTLARRQSTTRLQSSREQRLNTATARRRANHNTNVEPVSVVRGVHTLPKCKICGNTGHKQNNCQLHLSYHPLIMEEQASEFASYLLNHAPLSKESVTMITESVYKQTLKQCIQVLTVHTLGELAINASPSQNQLAFKVNVMWSRKKFEKVYENIFITYHELQKFITNMSRQNCRFVYSKVKEISVGNEFVVRGPRNNVGVMQTDELTRTMIPGNNNMAHMNQTSVSTMVHNRGRQFLNTHTLPSVMGYNNLLIPNNGTAIHFNHMNRSYNGLDDVNYLHNLNTMNLLQNQYGRVNAMNIPLQQNFNGDDYMHVPGRLEENEM